jgi:cytochrome b involved in lipid metabolism
MIPPNSPITKSLLLLPLSLLFLINLSHSFPSGTPLCSINSQGASSVVSRCVGLVDGTMKREASDAVHVNPNDIAIPGVGGEKPDDKPDVKPEVKPEVEKPDVQPDKGNESGEGGNADSHPGNSTTSSSSSSTNGVSVDKGLIRIKCVAGSQIVIQSKNTTHVVKCDSKNGTVSEIKGETKEEGSKIGKDSPSEAAPSPTLEPEPEPEPEKNSTTFTKAQVKEQKYTIIKDTVYDLSTFNHPGGKETIEKVTGVDGTDVFLGEHDITYIQKLVKFKKGAYVE